MVNSYAFVAAVRHTVGGLFFMILTGFFNSFDGWSIKRRLQFFKQI